MKNFEKDAEALLCSKATDDVSNILRQWSPLMFNDPMDYNANRMHSSISSTRPHGLAIIEMWFEDRGYNYCSAFRKIYCEPECATIFGLIARPEWKTIIQDSPYIDAPKGTMEWDR